MPISLLTVFSSSGEKNTSGLTQADGFPAAQKPARQWFNWLFNAYSAKINEIAGQVNTNTTDLSSLGTKAQLVDLIYPVGSIIEFNNTVNPNTQFAGTTWVRFGEGRVTVGLSDEVSDPAWTKTIGSTHGEFEHEPLEGEMFPHTHSNSAIYNKFVGMADDVLAAGSFTPVPGGSSYVTAALVDDDHPDYEIQVSAIGTPQRSAMTEQEVGDGDAFNVVQPSIVVARWVRTA